MFVYAQQITAAVSVAENLFIRCVSLLYRHTEISKKTFWISKQTNKSHYWSHMIVAETTRSTKLVNNKPKHNNNNNNSPRKKTNTQHPPSTRNQKQNWERQLCQVLLGGSWIYREPQVLFPSSFQLWKEPAAPLLVNWFKFGKAFSEWEILENVKSAGGKHWIVFFGYPKPYNVYKIICHFCKDLSTLQNILWIFVHICL